MTIPMFKVRMAEKIALDEVLQSGYIAQGPKVDLLEQELQKYTGSPFCATVNSGTSALHLALRMVKDLSDGFSVLKPWDSRERKTVLSIPLTCTATNFPILANGFDIRWVDTDPDTANVDLDDLARKMSADVAAIVVVHWAGTPCDLARIADIQDAAEKEYGYRPPLIEDAAHAFGAEWDGRKLGNHRNYVMHSFQAIKHFTTGDGGVLISPTYVDHKRAKLLRWFGLDREKSPSMRCEQNVHDWGYKFHLNDINAQIGLDNFKLVEDTVAKHKANGAWYNENLQGIPGVRLLSKPDKAESAYWIYSMRVENKAGFIKMMASNGVSVSQVHDRNDKHDTLRAYRCQLPGTDKIMSDIISIPCGWWVTEEDRGRVAELIKGGW